MEGYLGKKGKRMGSRVKRFMRLEGSVLSNHQDAGSPPSWRVNLKEATISCYAKRSKIIIELFHNKLELYADTSRECLEWYDALRTAKRKANLINLEEKENKDDNENIADNFVSIESTDDREEKARAQLGKNFKVVKPPSRYIPSANSSHSSDDPHDDPRGNNPLVVQGQTYEETPASMIFKQFTFPTKSLKS